MARKFVVIEAFKDLQDSEKHIYNKGDFYPREGAKLDEARADILASDKNKQKKPLIVEVLVKEESKQESSKEEEPKKETKKATKK